MDPDDQLRFHFAQALAGASPTDACPAPEQLLDGASGELSPEDTDTVIDHIAACPSCADAWRLARLTPAGAERRGE